ncbi:MAG: RraA family protein [Acidobacteria bacterium]|nr:RraA family protein [Acidobacteriota bacterium]
MDRRHFLSSAAALGLSPAAAAVPSPASPVDFKTLLALKRMDTPTAANAIETFDVRPRNEGFLPPDIKPVFPELGGMVGYAVPATIRASTKAPQGGSYVARHDWWDYIVSIPAPRVIVLQDLDDPTGVGSFWGEVNGSIHHALGAVGVVTDGSVRDLNEVRLLGFHFFSRHVSVSHAYVHMVEFGKPVKISGVTIKPGDLLHGDQHGVHTIPLDIAAKIPEAAAQIFEREHKTIDYCQSPEFSLEGLKKL